MTIVIALLHSLLFLLAAVLSVGTLCTVIAAKTSQAKAAAKVSALRQQRLREIRNEEAWRGNKQMYMR
jgi:hypothetical protein